MGQLGYLRWLLLALLLCDTAFADSRSDQQWEQWWRSYSQPGGGYGSPGGHPVVVGQPRAQSLPSRNPIRVRCEESRMQVTVQRDLYGNGRLVKASDLTLGPRRCTPSSLSTDTEVIFQNGLQECGNVLQMTQDWLIYSTNLTYNPTPSRNTPNIIRSNAATVAIQCYYPRHGNVSSKAIRPTWIPYSSTVSTEERLSFSLNIMSDDWRSKRTSTVFTLGEIFHIEASVDTGNHVPMKIFIDSCVATLNTDINSSPRYEIINQNGCLIDGKQEDSSSAFVSPRPQPDKLQFTVDAFRFTGLDSSTIFITCSLKAAAVTQVPDSMNKACSFSKSSNRWTPVNGPTGICSCCETGNCIGGQSRGLNTYYPRRNWKRQASDSNSEKDHAFATLGPLFIISDDQESLMENPESEMVELWVLVAVGALNLVVISVCIVINWKLYCKKSPPKTEQ